MPDYPRLVQRGGFGLWQDRPVISPGPLTFILAHYVDQGGTVVPSGLRMDDRGEVEWGDVDAPPLLAEVPPDIDWEQRIEDLPGILRPAEAEAWGLPNPPFQRVQQVSYVLAEPHNSAEYRRATSLLEQHEREDGPGSRRVLRFLRGVAEEFYAWFTTHGISPPTQSAENEESDGATRLAEKPVSPSSAKWAGMSPEAVCNL